MGFFTIGNLITLGIVLFILFLFRQMDRNNRNLKLLRDYSEKLKKEISAFAEEQEKAVKDYAISLNVEKDSAKELMKRLHLTEEEMAEKAAAVARIDSQIKAYKDSLVELERMTARVQENMNRVRDESAFVDATGRRISELKAKLAEIEKDLGGLEKQFERENNDSLEKTANSVIAAVKSEVSDWNAAAETIERKVEDTREEINKMEAARAAAMARDLEHINQILSTSVEQAAKRADKMEEAALVRLKEQAEERIFKLKTSEEEKIKSYHEGAKARVAEVQNLVKNLREQWRAERGEWENKDKAYRDERKKNFQELSQEIAESEKRIDSGLAVMDKQLEELSLRAEKMATSQEAMFRTRFSESEKHIEEDIAALDKRMEELSARAGGMVTSQEELLRSRFAESEKLIETNFEAQEKRFSGDLEGLEKRMDELSSRTNGIIASHEGSLHNIIAESEKHIQTNLDAAKKQFFGDVEVFEKRMDELSSRTNGIIASHEGSLHNIIAESEKHIQTNLDAAKKQFSGDVEVFEKRMDELSSRTNGIIASHEGSLNNIIAESEKRIETNLEAGEKRFSSQLDVLEKRMDELSVRANEIIAAQENQLLRAAEEMKQKALDINETKLEEYRAVQDAEYKRLEALADDSRKLDAELRTNMQDVINRVKDDFSQFEIDSANLQKAEEAKFSTTASALREELLGIESELSALKTAAYDNVSEKLDSFQDTFLKDLTGRSAEMEKRLLEWQENLDNRLSRIGEEAAVARQELERNFFEEMRRNLSIEDEKLLSGLDHLKAKTIAFEDSIREQMNAADESVISYKEQLGRGFEEAGKDAELTIKSEINKQSIAASESIKQYQRELEGKLREISEYAQKRSDEIADLVDVSKTGLDEEQNKISAKIKELDDTIEDARRRVRDLSAETDTRITSVRSSVEDAERHIREAVDQTKLIDKADALRLEMERRIEDLKADISRLDDKRAEALQLENDFIKIRRLEDDVNSKMTRFLSEKRRIETMETDFNRLIQISRLVEEKLTQVTSSGDTLQGIQLQIRKLEESLVSTEEKYQRMEKKNQILDNTNDGIDRNFKVLQDSEKLSTKIGEELDRYAENLDFLKISIEKLSAESEKANNAIDRIDVLDNALEEIEERIKSMQRARQWIVEAEQRLEGLNKDILIQVGAADSVMKGKKSGVSHDIGDGAPSIQKKENVYSLARQGWDKKQIAKALKITVGEVELILEMAPRD